MQCKICGKESTFFGSALLKNRFNCKYFKCSSCGFVQTETPYWLEDAYKDPINRSDVGYVYRNLLLSKLASVLITFSFNGKSLFIDYGAGYGLFVRLMRDKGFRFYHYDKYTANLFAPDFKAEHKNYELLTAFEVFEHLENPEEELKRMLQFSPAVLFSTELIPENNPLPGEWWYYGTEHGQHISLYSLNSLKFLAEKHNLYFYSNKKNIHLFSRKKINSLAFRLSDIYYKLLIINPFKRKSLVNSDFDFVRGKIAEGK